MQNVQETILSQFANSPRIGLLIDSMNQSLDPRPLIEVFYRQVMNPDTATGWGLDLWGRIVGATRTIEISSSRWFGFEQAHDPTDVITPFNEAPFYAAASSGGMTSNYTLTDDAFRKLIYAKAAANITRGSITAINAILMRLFGSETQHLWIEEDLPKRTITIVYDFAISLVDATLLESSGVLPRPTGVSIAYRRVNL